MEEYRAKLKIDTIITAILALVLLIVSLLAFANCLPPLPVTITGIPAGTASSAELPSV